MKNTTPAVLLYYEDFLTGIRGMSDEEVGQYILLLCDQNAKGHLSPDYIANVYQGRLKESVLAKFTTDENGCLFNERMEAEIKRRVKYSESRRANRASSTYEKDMSDISKTHEKDMSNISTTYVKHMETSGHMETETETETVNRNNNSNTNKEKEREPDNGFTARLKAMRDQRDAVLAKMR